MIETIIKEIKILLDNDELILDEQTPLIGDDSPLDSMNIVNLCIRLEEICEEQGFEFDWTGETMSKSRSMFTSISNLSKEIESQKNK